MSFTFRLLFFCCFLFSGQIQAQFKFSGQTNKSFINSKAYLFAIEDYKKSDLFLTNYILQESLIDSLGHFNFSGDFLSNQNKIYKIHIDQCNNDISNYQHLLNNCSASNSITFIANNQDSIYLPLNNGNQMFCSLEYTRTENIAIQKIDSIQEILLFDLHHTKSDTQRNIIFNTYFKKLQAYGKTFNDPLIELYVYQLYSNRKSVSRTYYLKDLKKSNYYTNLLDKLKEQYPNSEYAAQYQSDLYRDYPEYAFKRNNIVILILVILLSISLYINIIFYRKKSKKNTTIDYKKILSPQELKVFELMYKGNTNKEIAEKLFVSLSTVKSHINAIYTKLSISSRKEIEQFITS